MSESLNPYDKYLTATQREWRNFLIEFNFNLSCTIHFPFEIDDKILYAFTRSLERELAKSLNTQIAYIGFFKVNEITATSHSHILIKSKKPVDCLLPATHTFDKEFNIVPNRIFDYSYDLQLFKYLKVDQKNLEKCCQYIVAKRHMSIDKNVFFFKDFISNGHMKKAVGWQSYLQFI